MKKLAIYGTTFALFTSLSAAHLSAQSFSTPVIQIAPDFAMSNLNRELLDRRNAERRQNQFFAPNVQSNPGVDRSSLRFTSSKARQKQNLQKFVDRSKKVDPEGAAKMQAIFASADVMGLIDRAMGSVGLQTNNVADAYTAWWVSAYQASRGSTTTPSRKTYQAVRQQSENALLAVPSLTGASQAEKQELAEAYLIQAALIDSSVEEAQSNPQFLDAVKEAVKQGAKNSGLDLDVMTLTDEGFRMRETGDATDANPLKPDSQEDALAAASTESESNYGLIALAGGLGLAGAFGIARLLR
ncbi:hypothetical protein GCM10009096_23340 [Parasphingorhabdus litoris]|uniref:Uncharacterized protein n=1 Tax=Parasphingorhabdus litoris TaxID=394733 RepID=A0ABN1ANB7_9SPHN|nr:DUF6683 family protein [Parasphingorhabdus litoris]